MGFSSAIEVGPAPDGGLYVPRHVPRLEDAAPNSLVQIAIESLGPYLADDPLSGRVAELCSDAFGFGAPLVPVSEDTEVLELFRGPTAAFKDFGARFLAACLSLATTRPRTVLVATSGDTGSAVASAFARRAGFRVFVLFPLGKVSERQRRQLTGFGGNVQAVGVTGTFDDCQSLVKAALARRDLEARHGLLSANSISVGRWLPQLAYFAYASLDFSARHGRSPGIVVPSGNLGNGVAACLAMKMGFPIREVVLAFNANRAVPELFERGEYHPRGAVATPANAMDVGDPSNYERLRWLYPDREVMLREVSAVSISTESILGVVSDVGSRGGLVVCPHTAAGFAARKDRRGAFIIAATAHPAKFEEVVEPRIGYAVALPDELQAAIARPSSQVEIPAELAALERLLA